MEEEIRRRTALVQGLMSIGGNDNPGAPRRRMREFVGQTLPI